MTNIFNKNPSPCSYKEYKNTTGASLQERLKNLLRITDKNIPPPKAITSPYSCFFVLFSFQKQRRSAHAHTAENPVQAYKNVDTRTKQIYKRRIITPLPYTPPPRNLYLYVMEYIYCYHGSIIGVVIGMELENLFHINFCDALIYKISNDTNFNL